MRRYERESYLDAFLAFIDDTRGDEEMEVWNHLVFDLLIPLRLSDHATRHADAEIERALRKYWLPFLNEAGSHKIVKSIVRLLVAPYERSERRNAIALAHAAVSMGGVFGSMQPLDTLQEEYVMHTKEAMPKTMNQRALHSTLFKRGLNIGLSLRLVPYLRERWGRRAARQSATRPPSTRTEVAEMRRQRRM